MWIIYGVLIEHGDDSSVDPETRTIALEYSDTPETSCYIFNSRYKNLTNRRVLLPVRRTYQPPIGSAGASG